MRDAAHPTRLTFNDRWARWHHALAVVVAVMITPVGQHAIGQCRRPLNAAPARHVSESRRAPCLPAELRAATVLPAAIQSQSPRRTAKVRGRADRARALPVVGRPHVRAARSRRRRVDILSPRVFVVDANGRYGDCAGVRADSEGHCDGSATGVGLVIGTGASLVAGNFVLVLVPGATMRRETAVRIAPIRFLGGVGLSASGYL